MKYLHEISSRVYHWYENCPDISQDIRVMIYDKKPSRVGNRFLNPCPVCTILDKAHE